MLVTVAGLGGCPCSMAARPAVPARRLPFLLVVLCKGCPCCPARGSRSVPHLVGASFGVGVRLGLAVAVALAVGSVCGCGFGGLSW